VFIEMPFPKLLFEKIVLLSERSFPVFKFKEICLICKHWYSLWKKKELLAYVLRVYLQNHKDLAFKLKARVEYPQHDSYDQQTKFLSSVIFAENYTEHFIRGVIESGVKFGLINKYTKIIDAYGNLQCRGSICHEIYLDELKIGFLFKYLNISYECLRENDDQLYEIFERKVNKSSIPIRIYEIKNTKQAYINCSWIERKNIQRKIALIRNSSFINSEVVSEIILQLSHWKVSVEQRLFDDIKILKQIEREYCSSSFINSIPKNINIKMHLCSDIIMEEVLKNVIEASYENCLFKNDLVIPDHIRVELIDCRSDNDQFIAFSAGCDDFTVNGGTFKIKSIAMIGLGEVLLHNSFLRFSRKNKFGEGLLELTDIKINRTIRLEKNI
ncbi:putative LRR containing protein, partial [Trachipleistophora hominis]